MSRKIFCIGFHKTGTTSLTNALRMLGYRVAGPNGERNPDIAETVYEMAHSLADKYDAFQDNPWPVLYREMDERYPGSRFILTLRDPEEWIESMVRHFGVTHSPMREWIYGVGHPEGNEDIYLDRFKGHNREVIEYFRDRPDDLLLLDITKGDGWGELCSFLEKDIPDIPFPHANRAADRERANRWSMRLARKAKSVVRQFVSLTA